MHISKQDIKLEIKNYPMKGRGVSVAQPIKQGTVLETLPVLVMDADLYGKIHGLPIVNHTFVWNVDEGKKSGAIGFGFASMCNHAEEPNAVIRKNYEDNAIELIALRDIEPDEEVTIRYYKTYFSVF